jgi:Flp pilus assembly pilin Flp
VSRSVISCFRALFTTNDEGNAVTEYAVCLALIVLASIFAVNALGVAISELFPDLASLIS